VSELEANTGGEAPPPDTSIAGLSASPPTSQPGLILAHGRLTVREIAVQAAERSGATGISSAGIWIFEEVG
jgi:hypothetical protein